jgi:hypothetical protein
VQRRHGVVRSTGRLHFGISTAEPASSFVAIRSKCNRIQKCAGGLGIYLGLCGDCSEVAPVRKSFGRGKDVLEAWVQRKISHCR